MLFVTLGVVVFLQTCAIGGAVQSRDPISRGYINQLECSKVPKIDQQGDNVALHDLYDSMVCHDQDQWVKLKNELPRPKDCEDIQLGSENNATDGVYKIYPDGTKKAFLVYCDMTTAGGGWTVFQRRINGEVDFDRNWIEYKNGFGYLDREHWLGNDKLNKILRQGFYKLRIDIEDFQNSKRYAEYSTFHVDNEAKKYFLQVTGYTGNAGDSMSYHNGKKFSTRDDDNDSWSSSCSRSYKGGFWYNYCVYANLNGVYQKTNVAISSGVTWTKWQGTRSMKTIKMMIKKH